LVTFRGICGVIHEEEGCGGKYLREKKVLSLEGKSGGMLDDESGESIEEEVPVS